MLTARQLYFEAVKVGDELPPLVKPPVDRLQIARYAGAAQDWNPLSVDEQHARNAGFPSALVPAMISMGFLGELVVDWVRGARLRRFQARFVKIVWPGDVLTARGPGGRSALRGAGPLRHRHRGLGREPAGRAGGAAAWPPSSSTTAPRTRPGSAPASRRWW